MKASSSYPVVSSAFQVKKGAVMEPLLPPLRKKPTDGQSSKPEDQSSEKASEFDPNEDWSFDKMDELIRRIAPE